MLVSSPLSHMPAELDMEARARGSWQFLDLSWHARVQQSFIAWWVIQRSPLTSWSSLILSLSSPEGESSGNGGGCVQVGLDCRWDLKSGTPLAMSHWKPKLCTRGQQETTGPGFTLAVTIFWEAGRLVVQLFPDGSFPTSSRLCLSWPVRIWNTNWLRQCYWGKHIHFLSLYPHFLSLLSLEWLLHRFVQFLPTMWRQVYGLWGHRDSSPWQQLLTTQNNGLWSGLSSWLNMESNLSLATNTPMRSLTLASCYSPLLIHFCST